MTKMKYKILLLEPSNVVTHPFLGFEDLTQEVERAHRECYGNRHPFFVQIGRALQAANMYAPAIDVMIQQQPFVVNLVWGTIRFIIQVSDSLFTPSSFCPCEFRGRAVAHRKSARPLPANPWWGLRSRKG
jgi:hypothetical protein